MRIDIQGLGFPLTAPLLEHTERRLQFALTRTSARIKRVVVRLGNSNRPRGGEGRFCRIQVVLDGAQPVLIEDAGADLYAVIDRAVERAGRNVAKNVDRLRENFRLVERQPPASLPGDAFIDMCKN
jgi:ribosome-associated translation inhibitor RaiA